MKPKAKDVAAAAVQAISVGYTYDEMDCQAFVAVSYTHLDLTGVIVKSVKLEDAGAAEAFGAILSGTGCALGTVTATGRTGDIDIYYQSAWKALQNTRATYDARLVVRYGIADNVDVYKRQALRRNEWRDWIGLPPDEDMDELLALENYIPADRLGDQAKLMGGGGEDAE